MEPTFNFDATKTSLFHFNFKNHTNQQSLSIWLSMVDRMHEVFDAAFTRLSTNEDCTVRILDLQRGILKLFTTISQDLLLTEEAFSWHSLAVPDTLIKEVCGGKADVITDTYHKFGDLVLHIFDCYSISEYMDETPGEFNLQVINLRNFILDIGRDYYDYMREVAYIDIDPSHVDVVYQDITSAV